MGRERNGGKGEKETGMEEETKEPNLGPALAVSRNNCWETGPMLGP